MTFAANANDTQRRGWCATACFAATYDHGTVPYVSLGSARSVALHYDEGRVAVRPTVSADNLGCGRAEFHRSYASIGHVDPRSGCEYG